MTPGIAASPKSRAGPGRMGWEGVEATGGVASPETGRWVGRRPAEIGGRYWTTEETGVGRGLPPAGTKTEIGDRVSSVVPPPLSSSSLSLPSFCEVLTRHTVRRLNAPPQCPVPTPSLVKYLEGEIGSSSSPAPPGVPPRIQPQNPIRDARRHPLPPLERVRGLQDPPTPPKNSETLQTTTDSHRHQVPKCPSS